LNFICNYNKISVVARNVPFGPPSAVYLQPVKSSTGCDVDQLNQAWDISQDLLSDKFDFVGGNCTGLLNIQFVLLDRNLPWDMTTLWDHSQNATLLLDYGWDITPLTGNPSNLSFLERLPFSFPPERLLQFCNVTQGQTGTRLQSFCIMFSIVDLVFVL